MIFLFTIPPKRTKKQRYFSYSYVMADFPSQQQRYDGPLTEYVIQDMQEELNDEIECKRQLEDKNTAQKISDAESFVLYNGSRIDTQLATLSDLDKRIRDIVAENEQLQEADAEYTALVTSSQYIEIAEKIASLNAIAAALDAFLVQKGRRGRPPL